MRPTWVEDAAAYAGAGVTGFGVGLATQSRADNDPIRVGIAVVPVVVGGLTKAFADGILASIGEGVSYAGMGLLGAFAQKLLMSRPKSQSYRAWAYPSYAYSVGSSYTGYGTSSASGVLEI